MTATSTRVDHGHLPAGRLHFGVISGTMLLDGWPDVGRVFLLGAGAYIVMVAALRVSGKRTLAKLNAFDLVVTVALGSTLATIALSEDVSLTEGVAAITLLIAAQLVVAWTSVRTSVARRLVRSKATLVFDRGQFLDDALSSVRLTRSEVCQAIRSSGCGDVELVAAVVLESDGTLSVVTTDRYHSGSAMPWRTGTPVEQGTGIAPKRRRSRGGARSTSDGGGAQ